MRKFNRKDPSMPLKRPGFLGGGKGDQNAVGVSVPSVPPVGPTASDEPSSAAGSDTLFLKDGDTATLVPGMDALFAKSDEQAEGTGEFSLICHFGDRDYDAAAHVEYWDGHVEVVSTYGTIGNPRGWSTQTQDGAVVHVTGDQTTMGVRRQRGGAQEVIHIRLHPGIRAVMPWVYSAKKSGAGSFAEYQVGTYVVKGLTEDIPRPGSNATAVSVPPANACTDRNVYTLVPCVIHNTPEGARVEFVEKYSHSGGGRRAELRPELRDGKVYMDAGPENDDKD